MSPSWKATPEASEEFTVESVVSDQQPQEEEQPTVEAAAVSTSTATQSTPHEGEVNDATARLASLLVVIADADPKTTGDSFVLGTRIRSGDPVQRRFSNQMAATFLVTSAVAVAAFARFSILS